MLAHETAVAGRELLSPVWARYTNIVADHAEGCYIYADNGDRYLPGFRTNRRMTSLR